MERLTMRGPKFGAPISIDVCANVACSGICADCKVNELIVRLCGYEDTELTPEEVKRLKEYMQPFTIQDMDRFREIMQAEKDGRLVILPCKITDTVFLSESVYARKKLVSERVVCATIDHVTIGAATGKPVFDLCTESGNWYKAVEPGDFYMSREIAEKALKEQEENGK